MKWYFIVSIGLTIFAIGFFMTSRWLKKPGKEILKFLNKEEFEDNYQKALWSFSQKKKIKVSNEKINDQHGQKYFLVVTLGEKEYFFRKMGKNPWEFIG